jgi:hypothetical protein
MVGKIYKIMVNFISFIKELIAFFFNEMNKRLDEINDKINEQNEYNEVLKDCTQLNCVECKFNEKCEFSNLKKKGR